MGIKGIDYWVIVAGDLERTLGFYARLGFTIAWEHRKGRPRMPTIRINDTQKINVHGPDWPSRPGYLGARRPAVGGADLCLEWEGTVPVVGTIPHPWACSTRRTLRGRPRRRPPGALPPPPSSHPSQFRGWTLPLQDAS